jgi:hypothetical protein
VSLVESRITPFSKGCGGFRAVSSRQINQESATLEGRVRPKEVSRDMDHEIHNPLSNTGFLFAFYETAAVSCLMHGDIHSDFLVCY